MVQEPSLPEVYLAGPIQHADDGGSGWRDEVTEKFDGEVNFLNPLDKYDTAAEDVVVVPDGQALRAYEEGEDREIIEVTPLVEADKTMIDNSDGVLVGWSEVPSAGTPMEVLYSYERDVPVVVVFEGDDISPWMQYHADRICDSFSSGVVALVDEISKRHSGPLTSEVLNDG